MAEICDMQFVVDLGVDEKFMALREKVKRSFEAKMDSIIEKYTFTSTDDYEMCESTITDTMLDIDTGKYVYKDGDSTFEVDSSNESIENSDTDVSDDHEDLDFLNTHDHEMDMKRVSASDSFSRAFFIAISPIQKIQNDAHPVDLQQITEPPTKKRCHRQLNINDGIAPLTNDVIPETDLKLCMDCCVKICRLDPKNVNCTVSNDLVTGKIKTREKFSESPRKGKSKTIEKVKDPVRRKEAKHLSKNGLTKLKRAANDNFKTNNHSLPGEHYDVSEDDRPSNCQSGEEKVCQDSEEEITFLTCKSMPDMNMFPKWFIPSSDLRSNVSSDADRNT